MKNLFRSLLVVALVALATSAIAGTVFDRAVVSVPLGGSVTPKACSRSRPEAMPGR